MGCKLEYNGSTFTIEDIIDKQVIKPISILITRLDNLVEDGKVTAFRENRSYGIILGLYNTYNGNLDVFSGMICKNDFMVSNQPKKYSNNHSLKSKIIHSLENRTNHLSLPLLYLKYMSKVPCNTIENNRTYNLTEELKDKILNIIIKTIEDIDNPDTVNDKGIFINLFSFLSKRDRIVPQYTLNIKMLLKHESTMAPYHTFVKSSIKNALLEIKEHDDWAKKTLLRLEEEYKDLDLDEFTKKNIGKVTVRLPKKRSNIK